MLWFESKIKGILLSVVPVHAFKTHLGKIRRVVYIYRIYYSTVTRWPTDCWINFSLLYRFAGIDVMTLANNHLNDYGEKPVKFSRKILKNVGIECFGLNFGPYDTPQVCPSRNSFALYKGIIHRLTKFRKPLYKLHFEKED